MSRAHASFLPCVLLHLRTAPRRGWQREYRRQRARVRRDKRLRSTRATRLLAARRLREQWRRWH